MASPAVQAHRPEAIAATLHGHVSILNPTMSGDRLTVTRTHPGFPAAQSRLPGSGVQSQETSAQGGLVSPRLPSYRPIGPMRPGSLTRQYKDPKAGAVPTGRSAIPAP
jgi:hypothetical protein